MADHFLEIPKQGAFDATNERQRHVYTILVIVSYFLLLQGPPLTNTLLCFGP